MGLWLILIDVIDYFRLNTSIGGINNSHFVMISNLFNFSVALGIFILGTTYLPTNHTYLIWGISKYVDFKFL